ncbi:cysteine hydrolase family protein [Candidatus Epulonipiscium viviparus]|uniref:cysteine hydrolase family protein n=1 Tax=Candidatus Epulonipiscium viviparus TaxID=420336 RepID=UPI00273812C8|nr:isochorismatase family cysteine hydrolase [Candidatus Epulopiscium viviparus]
MKKALIIIDYIYDFVADDGKLTCGKPGQALEQKIVELVKEFQQNGDFVVVASDNHDESDAYNKERNMFPLHCYEEKGRALYGAVDAVIDTTKNYVKIDKNRYSAFCGTPLDLKLKERDVDEVHLVGVCTDICVLHTAVDAYNLGYKIVVHKDGVASFDAAGHAYALNHFKNVIAATVV